MGQIKNIKLHIVTDIKKQLERTKKMPGEIEMESTQQEKPSLLPGQSHEDFWGITLSKELTEFVWIPPEDEAPEDEAEEEEMGEREHKLRLTQVCLGRNPKDGERNLIEVLVKKNGRNLTTPIASLRTGPYESQTLDLVFSGCVQFSLVEGTGPVSLSGIHVQTMKEVEGLGEWDEDGDFAEVEEEMIKKFKDKMDVKDLEYLDQMVQKNCSEERFKEGQEYVA